MRCGIALYIILSRDVPLLKFDLHLQSEFLSSFSVGIGRAVEESNPLRYKHSHKLSVRGITMSGWPTGLRRIALSAA